MLPKFGEQRLKFPVGKQREFIEKVFLKSGLDAKAVAGVVNVSPRTVRDWKREKYNISEKAFDIFCVKFQITHPADKSKLISDWQEIRLRSSIKGGLAHFKKYGNFGTPEGRRKGGSKALAILRERGIISPTLKEYVYPNHSERLAEFVGIMLGDGGITTQQATITLNSDADKKYISFVASLGKKLFGQKPRIGPRRDCRATCLRYSGLKFIDYLTNIGLKTGNKVEQQVDVPDWIKKSDQYKIACLRGLMDTDGCIAKSTHRRKSGQYVYFNPCFTNASKPLLNFVKNTLTAMGFHASVTGRHVWLYNTSEVKKYFETIGSSNYRLLKFRVGGPDGKAQVC